MSSGVSPPLRPGCVPAVGVVVVVVVIVVVVVVVVVVEEEVEAVPSSSPGRAPLRCGRASFIHNGYVTAVQRPRFL